MLEDWDVYDLEDRAHILALPAVWSNTMVFNDKMSLVVKDTDTTVDSLID